MSAVKTRGEQLSQQIYRLPLRSPTLPPATETNAYLLGRSELTIVDPAAVHAESRAPLEAELAERVAAGAKVVGVFLTHHHRDHVGSAAWVAARYQCPIWAHPESAARLPSLSIEPLGAGALPIDGKIWEVIETPGHAPGHLCLVDPEAGDAIVGDMVAGIGTILIEPEEGDMSLYLKSLRALAERPIHRLLPAHGAALSPARDVLEFYIAHRLRREEKIYASLPLDGTSVSLDELVEVAYADAPAEVKRGPNGGIAGLSARAHLEKLLSEERVTYRAGRWALKRE